MDAKQVAERAKVLGKAATAGGVKPSEDLLRSTKIGVIVNRFKQNEDHEVAKLANGIVKKWRDEVTRAKAGTPTPNGSQAINGN
ncbi:MAG: hypothetical protein Q9180_007446, partial [Flavoplaca navasiana]